MGTQFAVNVNEMCGLMEEDCSTALFARTSFVKMTSLNIRLPARKLNLRISSVCLATNWANILVYDVKYASVMNMLDGKASNTRRINHFPVRSVAFKPKKRKTFQCQRGTTTTDVRARMLIATMGMRTITTKVGPIPTSDPIEMVLMMKMMRMIRIITQMLPIPIQKRAQMDEKLYDEYKMGVLI